MRQSLYGAMLLALMSAGQVSWAGGIPTTVPISVVVNRDHLLPSPWVGDLNRVPGDPTVKKAWAGRRWYILDLTGQGSEMWEQPPPFNEEFEAARECKRAEGLRFYYRHGLYHFVATHSDTFGVQKTSQRGWVVFGTEDRTPHDTSSFEPWPRDAFGNIDAPDGAVIGRMHTASYWGGGNERFNYPSRMDIYQDENEAYVAVAMLNTGSWECNRTNRPSAQGIAFFNVTDPLKPQEVWTTTPEYGSVNYTNIALLGVNNERLTMKPVEVSLGKEESWYVMSIRFDSWPYTYFWTSREISNRAVRNSYHGWVSHWSPDMQARAQSTHGWDQTFSTRSFERYLFDDIRYFSKINVGTDGSVSLGPVQTIGTPMLQTVPDNAFQGKAFNQTPWGRVFASAVEKHLYRSDGNFYWVVDLYLLQE